MTIEQGKLRRLNDTNINDSNLSDGNVLAYNKQTKKWEPKEVISGGGGSVGNPSGGQWNDGASNITPNDTIADALDGLNGILGELLPANALPISNAILNTSNKKYALSVVNGLGTEWDGAIGTTRNDITNVGTHTLTFDNSDQVFNNADKGILKFYLNDELKAKIDLGANFNESNRKSNQDITQYNTTGDGDIISGGEVTFDTGTFKIVSVEKYNGFSKWQKGEAIAQLTSAKSGKNEYQIGHEINGVELKSTKTIFYYDNITHKVNLNFDYSENTINGKYLSGVKYYTIGDTFNINITGTGLFETVYNKDNIASYYIPALNEVTIKQITIPNTGDSLVYNEIVALNKENVIDDKYNYVCSSKDLYDLNTDVLPFTSSETYLVHTYNTSSTKISESFTDEKYRLPLDFNFDDKTSTIVNVWDSTAKLENGNAIVYFKNKKPALMYPSLNLDSDVRPVQTNQDAYSFSGDQIYVRSFEGTNKGNATFELTGLSSLSDIKIEIKLPGMSGWGNALSPYDSTADKRKDGWGMLQGNASINGFTTTFGGLNTTDTNGRIYIRITLLNENASLEGISVGW